jgi:shikimate dehydrogenase
MDIIINATPLGLKEEDPLPIDLAAVNKGQIIGDLIYHETRLQREAASMGCRTFNGLGMLIWQGALAFELWTGEKAPYTTMRSAIEIR